MKFFHPSPILRTDADTINYPVIDRSKLPSGARVLILPYAQSAPEMMLGLLATYTSVTLTKNKAGLCMDCSGGAGTISVTTNDLGANHPSSVEILFELSTGGTGSARDLVSSVANGNQGYDLGITSGGSMYVDLNSGGGGGINSSGTLAVGKTYHAIATCTPSGGSNSLFLDGHLDNSGGTFNNANYFGQAVAKAGGSQFSTHPCLDRIYFVIFYDRELSANEVFARYLDPFSFLDRDEMELTFKTIGYDSHIRIPRLSW